MLFGAGFQMLQGSVVLLFMVETSRQEESGRIKLLTSLWLGNREKKEVEEQGQSTPLKSDS